MSEAPDEVNHSTISEYIRRFREQPPVPLSQRKSLGGREKFWWLPADQQAIAREGDHSRTNSGHDEHVGYDDTSLPEPPSPKHDIAVARNEYARNNINNWLDLSLSHIRDSQSSQAISDKHLLGGSFDFDGNDLCVDDVTRLVDQLVQKCESLLNQHNTKSTGPSNDSEQPAGSVRSSIQSSLLPSVLTSAPSSVQSSLQSSDSPMQLSLDASSCGLHKSGDRLTCSGAPPVGERDEQWRPERTISPVGGAVPAGYTVGVPHVPLGPLHHNRAATAADQQPDHYRLDQGKGQDGEGDSGDVVSCAGGRDEDARDCASDCGSDRGSSSDADSDSCSFMFISPSTSCASSVHHVRDQHQHQQRHSLIDEYAHHNETSLPAKLAPAAQNIPGGVSIAVVDMQQQEQECNREDCSDAAPIQAAAVLDLPVPRPNHVPSRAVAVGVEPRVDEAAVCAHLGDPVLARLWARLQEVRASIHSIEGGNSAVAQQSATAAIASSLHGMGV